MSVPSRNLTILRVSVLWDGYGLEVHFHDNKYAFHSQWLYDARGDRSTSRPVDQAFSIDETDARIRKATLGKTIITTLHVEWEDRSATDFPAAWVRVFAPLVARPLEKPKGQYQTKKIGWTTDTVKIQELDWNIIFPPQDPTCGLKDDVRIKIAELLLYSSSESIIKVTNSPEPDITCEKAGKDNFVTQVLKQIFDHVFTRPNPALDSSLKLRDNCGEDRMQEASIPPGYRVDHIILPRVDQAQYESFIKQPAQIMGLYCLEGESLITFVSGIAAWDTLNYEDPEDAHFLTDIPAVIGHVVETPSSSMYQATSEPAVVLDYNEHVKHIRWNCHRAGFLTAPFEKFSRARKTYQKYQEIMQRPSHQLKIKFKPGDMYIWNNHFTLNGRESILTAPHMSIGDIVPMHVVSEKYRSMQIKRLEKLVPASWLAHVPSPQLRDMAKLLGMSES
ncbi:putative Clavaminate synthase-like protein [Seiridium unicorne]|uniref:Clavaminate synthase-like protein n=1 Tax=Seiridium unicorne TaxID=138068 RepID=A0ABR2URG7_9PEZI